jgi:hypothetical protein
MLEPLMLFKELKAKAVYYIALKRFDEASTCLVTMEHLAKPIKALSLELSMIHIEFLVKKRDLVLASVMISELLKSSRNHLAKNLIIALERDYRNILLFGNEAPVFAEELWIDASKIITAVRGEVANSLFPRSKSAEITLECPSKFININEMSRFNFIVKRYMHNMSWDETGAYESIMAIVKKNGVCDGCRSEADVIERYSRLDKVFEVMKQTGLAPNLVINPGGFRGWGNPIVHFLPNQTMVFGWGGVHRFSIAHLLSLTIPFQVGCVHPDAMGNYAEIIAIGN